MVFRMHMLSDGLDRNVVLLRCAHNLDANMFTADVCHALSRRL